MTSYYSFVPPELSKITPDHGQVIKIYKLKDTPFEFEKMPRLSGELKVADRLFFMSWGEWYELCCLRS
jgi:hypothetical protein